MMIQIRKVFAHIFLFLDRLLFPITYRISVVKEQRSNRKWIGFHRSLIEKAEVAFEKGEIDQEKLQKHIVLFQDLIAYYDKSNKEIDTELHRVRVRVLRTERICRIVKD